MSVSAVAVSVNKELSRALGVVPRAAAIWKRASTEIVAVPASRRRIA